MKKHITKALLLTSVFSLNVHAMDGDAGAGKRDDELTNTDGPVKRRLAAIPDTAEPPTNSASSIIETARRIEAKQRLLEAATKTKSALEAFRGNATATFSKLKARTIEESMLAKVESMGGTTSSYLATIEGWYAGVITDLEELTLAHITAPGFTNDQFIKDRASSIQARIKQYFASPQLIANLYKATESSDHPEEDQATLRTVLAKGWLEHKSDVAYLSTNFTHEELAFMDKISGAATAIAKTAEAQTDAASGSESTE